MTNDQANQINMTYNQKIALLNEKFNVRIDDIGEPRIRISVNDEADQFNLCVGGIQAVIRPIIPIIFMDDVIELWLRNRIKSLGYKVEKNKLIRIQ